MSLILDALRKSEHERHGASDSVLPLIVTPRAGRARKKRITYLPILVILLVVIATAVVFIYRETIFPSRKMAQAPATPAVAKPQVVQQRRAEASIKEVQQTSTPEPDPTQSTPPLIGTEVPAPLQLPPVAERPKVAKQSLLQKPESTTPTEPASKPKAKSKPESRKQDAIPAALSTFPADFIRKVQPLHLDFHVYSSDISRRMVYINNREYEEGDRLKNSLTVVRIVPRGAVLQWNQQLFLLTSQD